MTVHHWTSIDEPSCTNVYTYNMIDWKTIKSFLLAALLAKNYVGYDFSVESGRLLYRQTVLLLPVQLARAS